jgi:hypothetical protein
MVPFGEAIQVRRNVIIEWGEVTDDCNPSYLGVRDQEDLISRLAWAQS